MLRPLLPLAAIFALVLGAGAALLYWPDRNEPQDAVETAAELETARPDATELIASSAPAEATGPGTVPAGEQPTASAPPPPAIAQAQSGPAAPAGGEETVTGAPGEIAAAPPRPEPTLQPEPAAPAGSSESAGQPPPRVDEQEIASARPPWAAPPRQPGSVAEEADRRGAPAGIAAAPTAPPGASVPSEPSAPAAPAPLPPAAPVDSPAAPEAAPTGAEAGRDTAPEFEVVQVEPTGEVVLSGRAAPGSNLEILADGDVIGGVTADAEGNFVARPDKVLLPGSHDFSVRVAGVLGPAAPEQHATVIVPQNPGGEAAPPGRGTGEVVASAAQPGADAGGQATPPPDLAPSGEVARPEQPLPPDAVTPRAELQPPEPGAAAGKPLPPPRSEGAEAPREEANEPADSPAPVVSGLPDLRYAPELPSFGVATTAPGGPEPASPAVAPTVPEEQNAEIAARQPEPGEPPVGSGATVAEPEPEIGVAPTAPDEGKTETPRPSAAGDEVGAQETAPPEGRPPASPLGLAPGPEPAATPSGPAAPAVPSPEPVAGAAAVASPDALDAAAPPASGPGASIGLPELRYEPALPNFDIAEAPAPEPGRAAGASSAGAAAPETAIDAAPTAPEAAVPPERAAEATSPEPAAEPPLQIAELSVRAEESGGEGAGEELPAIAAEIPVRIGEVSVSAAEPGAAGEPPQSSVDAPAAVETLSVSVAEPEAVAPPVASPQGEVDLTAPVGDLAIKAAEVENDTLYVAGEAAPGTSLRVFANEELVGRVEANDEGAWLLEAQKDVPVGEVVIRADAVAEDSAIPTAQIETPFMRLAEGVSLAPSVVAAGGGEAPAVATGWAPQPSFVIIRRGDNLWRISRRNYGRGIRYKSIFAANRDRIRNPNLIYPGQVFIVPTRDHGWERDPS